jgi:hypothetical protein
MQNNHYWSSQNPHLTHEILLYQVKVGVWCAVSARRIVGPVFLNERIHSRAFLFRVNRRRKIVWLVSARLSYCPHCTCCISMQALSSAFGDRIISCGIWPARSPDLNPCDFFFWDCLKDKVYCGTEEELKIFVRKLLIFLQNSFKG